MQEINCPHCNKAFKIDEAGYADIVKQVRDREFDQQITERLGLAEREKKDAVELAKSQGDQEKLKTTAEKDSVIQELKARIDANKISEQLAVNEAVDAVKSERDEVQSKLDRSELEKELETKSLKDKYQTQIKDRDDTIERLKDMKAHEVLMCKFTKNGLEGGFLLGNTKMLQVRRGRDSNPRTL